MKRFQHDVQYQLSSLDAEPDTRLDEGNDADNDDDDDDMQLGDEADVGLSEHMSDDDGHVSHSFNVSPTPEDDDNEPPELIDQKPLTTPPFSADTPPTHYREPLDLRQGYQVNHTYNRSDVAARSNDQDMETYLPLWSTSTKHDVTSAEYRTYRVGSDSIRSDCFSLDFRTKIILMVGISLNQLGHLSVMSIKIKSRLRISVRPFKAGCVIQCN